MIEKRKNKEGNAITSQFIFDRDVWLIRAKEREENVRRGRSKG